MLFQIICKEGHVYTFLHSNQTTSLILLGWKSACHMVVICSLRHPPPCSGAELSLTITVKLRKPPLIYSHVHTLPMPSAQFFFTASSYLHGSMYFILSSAQKCAQKLYLPCFIPSFFVVGRDWASNVSNMAWTDNLHKWVPNNWLTRSNWLLSLYVSRCRPRAMSIFAGTDANFYCVPLVRRRAFFLACCKSVRFFLPSRPNDPIRHKI